jgi:beta-lactamase class D
MKISPKNQVEFLIKVYTNQTPFSTHSTDVLKRVMITKEKDGMTLRSKTGWTRTEGKNIGWWVGYVESKDNVYFFATRITTPLGTKNPNFSSLRKDLTRAALKMEFGLEL